MVKRNKYLKKLIEKQHNGLIKVVTGIRRCGKSYLLFNIFYRHLISQGVEDSHIIRLALDDDQNAKYRNPLLLSQFLRGQIKGNGQYYIFLDEIQFVVKTENPHLKGDYISFYDVLNGLMKLENVDIYVTGSNSKMLSRDILTEFRGRSDEVHVFPLVFSEFYEAVGGEKADAWLEYYTFGGLPALVSIKNYDDKARYLINLFKETYLKDIIEKNNIKSDEDFEEILNYLASATGSLVNPAKLANTFKSVKNKSIAETTIKRYLDHLENAFLVNKALRFNVKGKKYISTPAKYYFEDVGLRNALLNFRQQEENHIMENIIYNELRYRGYTVDVGVVEINEKQDNGEFARKQLEIDFVANCASRRYYVQSAFQMPNNEKYQQEARPLLNLQDNFKKIIVVKDRIMLKRDEMGVVTMDIFDFLLQPNSLEL